jgi:signal transduction histidine kinase
MGGQEINNVGLFIALSIACLAFALISLLLFMRLRQNSFKQEKEKQLLLTESDNRLGLLVSSIEAEENQKQRIAKNLHDDVGTPLTLLRMNINASYANKEALIGINSSLDAIIAELRVICRDLTPNDLKLFGLNKAIEQLCLLLAKNTGVKIYYTCNYNGELQSNIHQVVLYRLLKKMLHNIIKYDNVSRIYFNVKKNGDKLDVSYVYDGNGITNKEHETNKKNSCINLNFINSRLMMLDGKINHLPDALCQNNQIILQLQLHGK